MEGKLLAQKKKLFFGTTDPAQVASPWPEISYIRHYSAPLGWSINETVNINARNKVYDWDKLRIDSKFIASVDSRL